MQDMIVDLKSTEIDLVVGGQSAPASSWQDCDPAGFLDDLLRQELFTGIPPGAPG